MLSSYQSLNNYGKNLHILLKIISVVFLLESWKIFDMVLVANPK